MESSSRTDDFRDREELGQLAGEYPAQNYSSRQPALCRSRPLLLSDRANARNTLDFSSTSVASDAGAVDDNTQDVLSRNRLQFAVRPRGDTINPLPRSTRHHRSDHSTSGGLAMAPRYGSRSKPHHDCWPEPSLCSGLEIKSK